MPKSNAERGKVFHKRKKKEKLAASPVEKAKKTKKKQKNITYSEGDSAVREYRAWKKNTAKYSLNVQLKNWRSCVKDTVGSCPKKEVKTEIKRPLTHGATAPQESIGGCIDLPFLSD
ncbi:hypothetical protein TNCV_3913111 [Trichonephila clavipes]|nr:hypothetical protein TNCV_3913111 [Trichonephila clavipes]